MLSFYGSFKNGFTESVFDFEALAKPVLSVPVLFFFKTVFNF